MKTPRIIIITGHYGSGKTNLAVNLSLKLRESGKTCAVADLDIVNPFFRTAGFARFFSENGIKLAVSDYAESNLDIPAVRMNVKALTNENDALIIDVGGDDEGAKVLGRYASDIRGIGYDMYYVINRYRYLTRSPDEAAALMREIEAVSCLKCTAIVNNSNLGKETSRADAEASSPYAKEVSRITGLPLIEIPVKIYVKPLWEV